jgi:hypothetical protein
MSDIRACTADDIPAVGDLFQRTFRNARRPTPPGLAACIGDLLLNHPDYDPDIASRVMVDAGRLVGFIGVVPLAMTYRGRRLRAAVPTSIAVEDPQLRPLAGAKLVRSFLSGPQDLSISEPANSLAQGLWQRLGGETVNSESMEWLQVLRPAGLAVALGEDRVTPLKLARPIAGLIDRMLARRVAARKVALTAGTDSAAVDDATFTAELPHVAAGYALHPDWRPETLLWQLAHAGANRSRGTLHRRIVYARGGKPVGAVLYHGRPGGIAWVLQMLARTEAARDVVEVLIADAAEKGCVAVKGRTQARFLDPLLARGALLFRRHTAMVHSRDPELMGAVRTGKAVTSGLAGESWMRHVSDRFD